MLVQVVNRVPAPVAPAAGRRPRPGFEHGAQRHRRRRHDAVPRRGAGHELVGYPPAAVPLDVLHVLAKRRVRSLLVLDYELEVDAALAAEAADVGLGLGELAGERGPAGGALGLVRPALGLLERGLVLGGAGGRRRRGHGGPLAEAEHVEVRFLRVVGTFHSLCCLPHSPGKE